MLSKTKLKANKIPPFEELPKHLQHKNKNSIIFQRDNTAINKPLKVDADKLKLCKIEKEKTI
jgi:hypothetical protein